MHVLGRRLRVDDEIAPATVTREVEERRPDPLVELKRLRLEPVTRSGGARQAVSRVDVKEDRQVRHEPARGPARQPSYLVLGQTTAAGLVGDRRVDVTVADDDRAAFQR